MNERVSKCLKMQPKISQNDSLWQWIYTTSMLSTVYWKTLLTAFTHIVVSIHSFSQTSAQPCDFFFYNCLNQNADATFKLPFDIGLCPIGYWNHLNTNTIFGLYFLVTQAEHYETWTLTLHVLPVISKQKSFFKTQILFNLLGKLKLKKYIKDLQDIK